MTDSRRIDRIVEEEIQRWQATQARPRVRGCVALSHQSGSRAHELARIVADRLGYALFDRELVEEIVRDEGIQKRLVEAMDERVRPLVERFVLDAFHRPAFSETDYLRSLARVLRTLASRGGVVLLGRGAPYLLTPAEALRVLVVAPRDARLEQLGREAFAHDEERRRHYLRHHFGVDRDEPDRFELAVNTATLGLETASQLVVEAVGAWAAAPHRHDAATTAGAGP
jgi:cytidylate kinase